MTQPTEVEKWLYCRKPNPTARVRLICIPYAGGGVTPFHHWPDILGKDVEVCVALLPGRERRFREPLAEQFDSIVEQLYEAVRANLNLPLALFGYSMGSLLAFELARRLRSDSMPTPIQLFVAARQGPQFESNSQVHECEDEVFLTIIQRRYGGVPEIVLRDQEMRSLFVRILRADFRVIASYNYAHEPPLDCPISVFGGADDPAVDLAALESWREHTSNKFSVQTFPGDHFFLESNRLQLIAAISKELATVLI